MVLFGLRGHNTKRGGDGDNALTDLTCIKKVKKAQIIEHIIYLKFYKQDVKKYVNKLKFHNSRWIGSSVNIVLPVATKNVF